MHIRSIEQCMAKLAQTPVDRQYSCGFIGETSNTVWYLAAKAKGRTKKNCISAACDLSGQVDQKHGVLVDAKWASVP